VFAFHEELVLKGMRVEVEMPVRLTYRERQIDVGYRIDLLVEDRVLVELKALTKVLPVHEAQLLSYLRLGGYPVGLLINFHVLLLRDAIRRMVNQMPDTTWSPSTTEKT
jgi:GxxExxY protein